MDTRDLQHAAHRLFDRVRDVDGRAPESVKIDDVSAFPVIIEGQLAGLAWRSGNDPAELYVDPDFRRQGIGRNLAGQLLADGVGAGIWAHGTDPAAAALASELGLAPVRELLQLRAPLPAAGVHEVAVPDGVQIRAFVPGVDDTDFLAVNAAAFAWHPEQGRLDQAGLNEAMAEPWFDPAGFFVAESENSVGEEDGGRRLLGFHWTKVHDETVPPVGEVYVIGVHPESPIRGLGTPLLVAGLQHLTRLGLGHVILYVEADNERALRLYRRFGFDTAATDTVFAPPNPSIA